MKTELRRLVSRLVRWSAGVGLAALLGACSGDNATSVQQNVQTAEALIDAFYSFDPKQLEPLLASAPESAAGLLFYQGWAEGGNYKILARKACEAKPAEQVVCAITVDDDPMLALGLVLGVDFKVTDTFTLSFADGVLTAVKNSSDDQPIYYEAYEWVVANKPEVMSGPCQGFFKDGPTPGDCARAMTAGYREFAEQYDFAEQGDFAEQDSE